jgi:hypothetical protein
MDRLLMYRKMHVLLREIGIETSKPYLLESYGALHTTELSDGDLQGLIDRLLAMREDKNSRHDEETKRWRSNLLTILNKYGIYASNNDWTAVNRILLNKRIAGKLLYEMNINELQQACVRLRIILSKRADRQDLEKDLALQN